MIYLNHIFILLITFLSFYSVHSCHLLLSPSASPGTKSSSECTLYNDSNRDSSYATIIVDSCSPSRVLLNQIKSSLSNCPFIHLSILNLVSHLDLVQLPVSDRVVSLSIVNTSLNSFTTPAQFNLENSTNSSRISSSLNVSLSFPNLKQLSLTNVDTSVPRLRLYFASVPSSISILSSGLEHSPEILFHFPNGTLFLQPFTGTLDLSGNRIKALTESDLLPIESLSALNLSNNQLDLLSVPILPHLASLDLSHNRLTTFKAVVLTRLPALTSLSLAHNPLTQLALGSPDVLINSPLTALDLTYTWLESLGEHSFGRLPHLRELRLERAGRLRAIGPRALAGLTGLERLALTDLHNLTRVARDLFLYTHANVSVRLQGNGTRLVLEALPSPLWFSEFSEQSAVGSSSSSSTSPPPRERSSAHIEHDLPPSLVCTCTYAWLLLLESPVGSSLSIRDKIAARCGAQRVACAAPPHATVGALVQPPQGPALTFQYYLAFAFGLGFLMPHAAAAQSETPPEASPDAANLTAAWSTPPSSTRPTSTASASRAGAAQQQQEYAFESPRRLVYSRVIFDRYKLLHCALSPPPPASIASSSSSSSPSPSTAAPTSSARASSASASALDTPPQLGIWLHPASPRTQFWFGVYARDAARDSDADENENGGEGNRTERSAGAERVSFSGSDQMRGFVWHAPRDPTLHEEEAASDVPDSVTVRCVRSAL